MGWNTTQLQGVGIMRFIERRSSSSTSDAHNVLGGLSARQDAWNGYGIRSQRRVRNTPELEIVNHSPYKGDLNKALMESLGKLENKVILEIGCCTGSFAIYLAKQGADVFGCDIAFEAVKASHQRAKLNKVNVKFLQVNLAFPLPIGSDSFDIVVGIDVCHHLARPDVLNALNETYRILRKGGKAIFIEPVEDSRMFDFIQNLFPSGEKDSGNYRPSWLSRHAFRNYLEQADDRALTSLELLKAGQKFKSIRLRQYGLLVRLTRLFEYVGYKSGHITYLLERLDNFILKYCSPMRRFCRKVVVEYLK